MCDPVTAAIVIGSTISGGSAIASGMRQKKMADYQAAQYEADANADQQAAEITAQKRREHARRVASTARANLAASGASLDSVTADAINRDIIYRGEMDAQNEINNSADAASRLRAQAQGLRMQGSAARTAGYAKAAGSALSTFAGVKAGWYGSPEAA